MGNVYIVIEKKGAYNRGAAKQQCYKGLHKMALKWRPHHAIEAEESVQSTQIQQRIIKKLANTGWLGKAKGGTARCTQNGVHPPVPGQYLHISAPV